MTDILASKKIVIIGLGLIGGSIARGLANRQQKVEVIGVGRNEAILQQAQSDGVINAYSTDIKTACADVDLIVIAVPTLTVESILVELKTVVSEKTVITDAASVKSEIIDAVIKTFGKVPANFVPGHPIAGSEHSGYSASSVDLYQHKKVILTPLDDTDEQAINLVSALWQALGAEVLTMSVSKHDAILAATSHLPHLLAFTLVDTLSQQGESEEIFRYAAGGFRDFTRIASSDPQMWHDIFMANGDAIVDVLDVYMHDLNRIRQAVLDKNSEELKATFSRAKKSRDKFLSYFENGSDLSDG
jgi:prephenate dehydrogenase